MASSCWESASFARGREFEPGLRHKKRPHMEASSMLDKSFCAKPNKRVWPTTISVVTQTHLSRIAQKSLSVLCRDSIHSRIRKRWWSHGVLNAILFNYVKSKKKASPEVASKPAKERGLWYYDFKKRDEFIMSCEATSFAHTNTIHYITRPMRLSASDKCKQASWGSKRRFD